MTASMKKLLIPIAVIVVCAVVLFALSAALGGTAEAKEQAELDQIISQVIPGGAPYEPEEYDGSNANIKAVYRNDYGVAVDLTVSGFADDIRLLVGVLNDGTVYSVSVLDAHDTFGLGQVAKNDWDFLGSLLGGQGGLTTADIDVITGATITSNAVMNAVNAASDFVTAGSEPSGGGLTGTADGFAGPITVEVTMDGDTITGVTVVSNSESAPSTALEDIPAAIVEANSPDVDVVAGATYTSNGIINAVKNALENAGSSGGGLTGTADGFAGPITVEVTMDGDTITGVTVVSNSESAPSTALEDIPAAIVEANSPDVDVVAGATYTSNGIINAVKNAIGAAA